MWLANDQYACRVSVESIEVARSILEHLSGAFVFKASEPMRQGFAPPWCSFRVIYGSDLSFRKLAALLTAMPGACLQVSS
ncbi:MAG: hypothetical protein KDA44_12335 [Planctomycetales bacterium]|nr:hypothetical protein [Planctomycetales bacterium]